MSIRYKQSYIPSLDELDVREKSVLLRLDLNVPLEDGQITDETRIQAALPTLKYCLEQKAKVAVISHLGRPQGKRKAAESLMPIAQRLGELLQKDVIFADDCVGDGVKKCVQQAPMGSLILLENLRFHRGEKASTRAFAEQISKPFDIYVNDAFGALHREDASVVLIPEFFADCAIGFLVEKEINMLTELLSKAQAPFSLVLGGAKVSDKIRVIENLLSRVDRLFIGGAMAFTFLASEGVSVGDSKMEPDCIGYAERILKQIRQQNKQLFLPKDFTVAANADSENVKITSGRDIADGWMGLDIGPQSCHDFEQNIKGSKTVFWNGPMGFFEKKSFVQGTQSVAETLAKVNGFTVVGGGDSAAAVRQLGYVDEMSHISTGGGATLEFLSGKWLPGLKVLVKQL